LQNLWLILIGVDPANLGSEYEPVIATDTATCPEPRHVNEFISTFASKSGRQLASTKIAAETQALCSVLGAKPTHESWRSFHQMLVAKCRAIREGQIA
jgi:hypothetical protein